MLGWLHVSKCSDDEATNLERHPGCNDRCARRPWLAGGRSGCTGPAHATNPVFTAQIQTQSPGEGESQASKTKDRPARGQKSGKSEVCQKTRCPQTRCKEQTQASTAQSQIGKSCATQKKQWRIENRQKEKAKTKALLNESV